METSLIYPYKSNPLELEKIIGNVYPYVSKAHSNDVLSTIIGQEELRDSQIGVLANQFRSSHAEFNYWFLSPDSYFVLKEGVLDGKEYQLGKLLIAIEYNFRNNKPRIRLIGKRIGKRTKQKPQTEKIKGNGEISVKLLTITNFRRFVKNYLRRDDSQGQESYTGEYEGIAKRQGIPEIATG